MSDIQKIAEFKRLEDLAFDNDMRLKLSEDETSFVLLRNEVELLGNDRALTELTEVRAYINGIIDSHGG